MIGLHVSRLGVDPPTAINGQDGPRDHFRIVRRQEQRQFRDLKQNGFEEGYSTWENIEGGGGGVGSLGGAVKGFHEWSQLARILHTIGI